MDREEWDSLEGWKKFALGVVIGCAGGISMSAFNSATRSYADAIAEGRDADAAAHAATAQMHFETLKSISLPPDDSRGFEQQL